MSYPDTIVPWLSFWLHWLDSKSMANCSAAQTVATLHLVSYDPHLHNHHDKATQINEQTASATPYSPKNGFLMRILIYWYVYTSIFWYILFWEIYFQIIYQSQTVLCGKTKREHLSSLNIKRTSVKLTKKLKTTQDQMRLKKNWYLDTDLVQGPYWYLAHIIGDVFPGGALRVAGGHTLSVP